MNILVIGRFYEEGFGLHIAETLAGMGHRTIHFDPVTRASEYSGRYGQRLNQITGVLRGAADNLPAMRAFRMRSLWRLVAKLPVALVIVCHDFLWPGEVETLKRMTGAKIALWFPDAVVNIGRGLFMNAPYDALFFKDPYIVQALGPVLKTPVFYLPECFSKRRHWLPEDRIGNDLRYDCDISIVGNPHAYRVAFFGNLSAYDVKLWGNLPSLWLPTEAVRRMHQKCSVCNEDKVRAFRGSKITVNNLHYGEIWGVNARTFEAAGAGAFQLMDWRPGLAQLFSSETEIITFQGIHELKQKIDYWLPRNDERREIGMAAMRRAHDEHTYDKRLALLLLTINGQGEGFPMPDITYTIN